VRPILSASQARGALLGLAVGDALGAPLELSTPGEAHAAVGRGLAMTGGGSWAPGEWTDDTALALCLAESIAERGLLDTEDLVRRYIAWANDAGKGIGRTTRAALQGARDAADARSRAREHHERTGFSAGNGTVMRATPIALAARSTEDAARAARADAALTHFDPAAAGASAALCAALIAVGQRDDPVAAAAVEAGSDERLAGVLEAVRAHDVQALAEAASGPQRGTCWTALGVGLSALAAADYERGVVWAISLGGDTDTNAAVAGALLGCRHGVQSIPERWLAPLRDRERIERAATTLHTAR
jgi:ADP-ribosyl-[dinitrogen reductase] hydrolase